MDTQEIKEKIRRLELEWKVETSNDVLTYLNGQLNAWREILWYSEKNEK